jgi:hypothetical protein
LLARRHEVSLFIKAVSGALAAVLLAWVGILTWHSVSVQRETTNAGVAGLGAEAGGWNYLLQLPTVLLLLTAAFGIGLFLTVRFARPH